MSSSHCRRFALQTTQRAIVWFASNTDGGEVLEYALVIALVVIGLVLGLGSSTSLLPSTFMALYARVAACLAARTAVC